MRCLGCHPYAGISRIRFKGFTLLVSQFVAEHPLAVASIPSRQPAAKRCKLLRLSVVDIRGGLGSAKVAAGITIVGL